MTTNSDKRKYLWCMNLALGMLPHPFASEKQLENGILLAIIDTSGTVDPELPDGYLSVVLPVLKRMGWSQNKITQYVKYIFTAQANGNNQTNGNQAYINPSSNTNGDGQFQVSDALGIAGDLLFPGASVVLSGGSSISNGIGDVIDIGGAIVQTGGNLVNSAVNTVGQIGHQLGNLFSF